MTPLVVFPSHPEAEALGPAVPSGVDMLVCGVGVVAAALNVERALVAQARPVLLVGVAGTRDEKKVAIGQVVDCTLVVNEAVGAGCGDGFVDLAGLAIPGEDADLDALACVPLQARVSASGPIATVAFASGSPDEADGWRRRHPEVLAEEMEGWGVALAARRARVPLTMARGICNVAGDRDHARWQFGAAFEALREVLTEELA